LQQIPPGHESPHRRSMHVLAQIVFEQCAAVVEHLLAVVLDLSTKAPHAVRFDHRDLGREEQQVERRILRQRAAKYFDKRWPHNVVAVAKIHEAAARER